MIVVVSRMEKWAADEWRADLIFTGEDSESNRALGELLASRAKPKTENGEGLVTQLFRMAKEIIFDVDDQGTITLTPMTWTVNTNSFEYVLTGLIEGRFDDEEDVKIQLVRALANEVPVVPNTTAVAPRLEAIFADLLANGFRMNYEGKEGMFVIGERLRIDRDDELPSGRLIVQPAEFRALQLRLQKEREEFGQAQSVLSRIDAAIGELRELLARTDRNEHDLQRCLTKYPILFGPGYRRVVPKHRLGSEYEVDYALELADGSVDVMEIEASTHSLYTQRAKNPSAALVHAEQQVLDWLAWLDQHSPYARTNLPGVRRPSGIVVIGRKTSMSEADQERLRWRNLMYGGRLTILTFDDLLIRCESLRDLLLEQRGDDVVER